ncbi:alpha/beta fold hydrolase [uncultured Kocuria sp.]|uniref:alpha/beta fold hydrolase n=1 Tax=uncultured Kocuria sp. TaxID=259305 RepID=UPI002608380C|nr:alpha/beta fold hydrolase [uncultured Kocuria sp.]
MANPELVALPVGFERFHRRDFINYQLNRAHALGFADRQELFDAAAHVRSMDDCAPVFESLSSRAAAEDRARQAAGYARIAEFFTPPRTVQKRDRYLRYLELFDTAFADAAIDRHEVPCAGAALPAYALPAAEPPAGGTVLLHGGFDSLIEEFFPICQRIAAAGFDVIAFEGPGQGGARTVHELTFDHDWEKPVAAVLDHFRLDRAALVGISMGGYWALRAAGREPRIEQVVAWPPVYDWLHRVPPVLRAPVRAMVRHRDFMRWSVRTRARLSPTLRAVVDQVLYMLDSDDPADVAEWFLGMNAGHLDSGRVRQDVLLMCGEHDAFQPPSLTRAQAQALTAARSVTTRMFTRAEQADQHCQMGNLELACQVLTTWLRSVEANVDASEPQPGPSP